MACAGCFRLTCSTFTGMLAGSAVVNGVDDDGAGAGLAGAAVVVPASALPVAAADAAAGVRDEPPPALPEDGNLLASVSTTSRICRGWVCRRHNHPATEELK